VGKYVNPNYVTPRIGQGQYVKVKMNYSEKNLALTTRTTGTADYYSFSVNDIYKPNFTGTGHQPLGYDQYAVMYEEYLVTSVYYKVLMSNASTTNRILCGVYASDKSTVETGCNTIIEQGLGQHAVLGIQGDGGQTSFSGYIDVAKLNGLDLQSYRGGADYRTVMGSSPADISFLTLWAADFSTGSGTGVNFNIYLSYNVELRGNVLLNGS